MPRAVFTGSIRKLSVGDPAAHLRVLHISGGPGGVERRDIRCSQRCTVRAPSPLDVPMEDKLMGSSAVILGVPFLSPDFPVFLLAYRRRSKREIGSRSRYPPLALPSFLLLASLSSPCNFLQSMANSREKGNTEKSISDAWITIRIARFERPTRCRAFIMNETSRLPMVRDFPGIREISARYQFVLPNPITVTIGQK